MSEDVLPLREEPLSVSMGLDIEEHDHVTACRRPCTLLLDLVRCAPEHI